MAAGLERGQDAARRRPPARHPPGRQPGGAGLRRAANGSPASAKDSPRAGCGWPATVECDWWPDSAYDAVSRALEGGLEPRALICLNDRVALGAYQALRQAGRVIPDDVSVVSFDDSDLAAWLRPQLTSISLPHYQLGWQAVEKLLGPPSNQP